MISPEICAGLILQSKSWTRIEHWPSPTEFPELILRSPKIDTYSSKMRHGLGANPAYIEAKFSRNGVPNR